MQRIRSESGHTWLAAAGAIGDGRPMPRPAGAIGRASLFTTAASAGTGGCATGCAAGGGTAV